MGRKGRKKKKRKRASPSARKEACCDHTCFACGRLLPDGEQQVHHVVFVRHGGGDKFAGHTNLVCLCQSCHRDLHSFCARTVGARDDLRCWMVWLRLYHPEAVVPWLAISKGDT